MKTTILLVAFVLFQSAFATNLPHWCHDTGRFKNEVENYERQDTYQNNLGKILFIGSSSFRLWDNFYRDFEGHPVINRGIGGAVICDLLIYMDRMIAKYVPPKIFLYIGENDVAQGMTPEQTLERFEYLLSQLRVKVPQAKIYFISMKPSPARAHYFTNFQQTNDLINQISDKYKFQFIDIFQSMLKADGTVREDIWKSDQLHMNQKGYAIWLPLILPYL